MPDPFSTAADGAASAPSGWEPHDEAASSDGETLLFRRYRVLRELGRGGMGVVLLAHDTALDIPVAVKLVPDLVVKDTEAIADLRKEVLRGMALNHDGVVRTHHFEKDESGAGIVMEYVEGQTLTELKQAQPGGCFDPDQVLPWIEQLCAVLDYAHREKRIVHRDLKPRNIMITQSGRVKVADFGIAALVNDSISRHSMEGKISGTLSYMSPQQAEGRRPNALDDIYSLGATVYELLTGKPPFFRGNPASIHAQIMSVAAPSIAERREELENGERTSIPPQWEATIAACLAKDPAERPQSAAEVLQRLSFSEAPYSGATSPLPAKTEKTGSRTMAAVVVATLLVLATGALVWLEPWKGKRDTGMASAPTTAEATAAEPGIESPGSGASTPLPDAATAEPAPTRARGPLRSLSPAARREAAEILKQALTASPAPQ